MLITTGKVLGGTIMVEVKNLPEGAVVTVLAPEGDETFELLPEEEAKLLAAISKKVSGAFVLHIECVLGFIMGEGQGKSRKPKLRKYATKSWFDLSTSSG